MGTRKSNSGNYSKKLYFIELINFSTIYGPFNNKPTRQLKEHGLDEGLCILITYELDDNLNYIRK